MESEDLEKILLIFYGLFTLTGSYFAFSSVARRLKKPRLISLIQYALDTPGRLSFSLDPEIVDRKIKRASRYCVDTSHFERQAALIQLNRFYHGLPADINKFLDHFARFIGKDSLNNKYVFERFIKNLAFQIIRKITNRQSSEIELIDTSFTHVVNGDLALFLREWNGYGSRDNVAIRAAYVLTLDKIVEEFENISYRMNEGQRSLLRTELAVELGHYSEEHDLLKLKANKAWQRFLGYLLEHYEFSEIVTEAEKKRILAVDLYEKLRSMLRFKESESMQELEQEMCLLFELELLIDNPKYRVVDVLRLFKSGDLFYLAEKFVNGRTLSDYISNIFDLELIKRVVDYTALIHARIDPRCPRKDYLTDLKQKISRSNLSNRLKQKMVDNVGFVLREFSYDDIVIDVDPIPDNYIISQDGCIYRIDLANRGSTHSEMDLTKLLNRDRVFTFDDKGDEHKKEIIIGSYIPGIVSRSKRKINDDDFYRRTLVATAYKAILYFVFAQTRCPERLSRAREFLQNGAHDLEVLLERHSSRYSRDELSQIKTIKQVTEELVSLN